MDLQKPMGFRRFLTKTLPGECHDNCAPRLNAVRKGCCREPQLKARTPSSSNARGVCVRQGCSREPRRKTHLSDRMPCYTDLLAVDRTLLERTLLLETLHRTRHHFTCLLLPPRHRRKIKVRESGFPEKAQKSILSDTSICKVASEMKALEPHPLTHPPATRRKRIKVRASFMQGVTGTGRKCESLATIPNANVTSQTKYLSFYPPPATS